MADDLLILFDKFDEVFQQANIANPLDNYNGKKFYKHFCFSAINTSLATYRPLQLHWRLLTNTKTSNYEQLYNSAW